MIISILGALALITIVTTVGAVYMQNTMDWLEPRLTFIPASVITSLAGASGQLGLGLLLIHLVKFFGATV